MTDSSISCVQLFDAREMRMSMYEVHVCVLDGIEIRTLAAIACLKNGVCKRSSYGRREQTLNKSGYRMKQKVR